MLPTQNGLRSNKSVERTEMVTGRKQISVRLFNLMPDYLLIFFQ